MTSATAPVPLTWVIGAGGLLGGHCVAGAVQRGGSWRGPVVPWEDPVASTRILDAAADEFIEAAGDRAWQVVWAAGVGVTSATEESLAREVDQFVRALERLGDRARAGGVAARGAVFYASSAGGVYAGVQRPPYDEDSPVHPLAPYGRAKLKAEAALAGWTAAYGVASLSGRIANLYGPGQNLAKAQGLISQLCWHHLIGRPLSVYVSLDTIRDYLYAPDAGLLVLDALDALRAEAELLRASGGTAESRLKVLCSGRPVTVASLIAELRWITRRRPHLILAASPAGAFQARNLTLRSRVYPEVDRRPLTPLTAGVGATLAHLTRQLQSAGVPA